MALQGMNPSYLAVVVGKGEGTTIYMNTNGDYLTCAFHTPLNAVPVLVPLRMYAVCMTHVQQESRTAKRRRTEDKSPGS